MKYTALSKAEAQAYKARWAAVNAAEREELRRMPMEQKLQQLSALMSSADVFGSDGQRAGEVAVVRERWNQLRRAMLG